MTKQEKKLIRTARVSALERLDEAMNTYDTPERIHELVNAYQQLLWLGDA